MVVWGQRIFPVCGRCVGVECYLCRMKPTQLLRAILPDVLIDNLQYTFALSTLLVHLRNKKPLENKPVIKGLWRPEQEHEYWI